MKIGLRIDVDTFRGTRDGVPALCRILERHSILGTFFFSAGPDNMGRNLWRLLRPTFMWKMLRTRAASIYGWDILLRGTLWPGPVIALKLAPAIRAAADAGHEIGLHAWDHQAWQTRIDRMNEEAVFDDLMRGFDLLAGAAGKQPTCTAAPAWKATDASLRAKDRLPVVYNSDCRGESIFRPVVAGRTLNLPQVPTTLPTYDELIGREGVNAENYNDHILGLVRPSGLNVLTVHAEAEGNVCATMFDQFLGKARARGLSFAPLGTLVAENGVPPAATVGRREIAGRDGWLAWQEHNGGPGGAAVGEETRR